jgi:CBS-domain-containing membrane protein
MQLAIIDGRHGVSVVSGSEPVGSTWQKLRHHARAFVVVQQGEAFTGVVPLATLHEVARQQPFSRVQELPAWPLEVLPRGSTISDILSASQRAHACVALIEQSLVVTLVVPEAPVLGSDSPRGVSQNPRRAA